MDAICFQNVVAGDGRHSSGHAGRIHGLERGVAERKEREDEHTEKVSASFGLVYSFALLITCCVGFFFIECVWWHRSSTPMMDLLVQATTAHRLSPGNYSIQAMGERGVLPYKPSTPIGTLDAFKIKIVDKKLNSHKKAPQVSFLESEKGGRACALRTRCKRSQVSPANAA